MTESQRSRFRFRGRDIRRVAVIGAGQIGPDIALHLVKALARHRVETLVLDIAPAALVAGEARISRKIAKGVETGAFREAEAERMRESISCSSDYARLAGTDLVVEAASENLAIKRRIFADVERLLAPESVLLSNSSHIPPSLLFADLREPGRAAVAHYFYPAERNPVVEIAVPASGPLADWLLGFYEEIGKVPVRVRDRFGHALNPVFEGLFLASALAVEEGLGTTREVDAVARRALRLGVGPFTVMNLTGGNPITREGLPELGRRLHPWFRVPRLLEEAMADGGPTGRAWDVAGRGEEVVVEEDRARKIADRLTAAYLGLSAWTVEDDAMALADLDLACKLALSAAPPFGLINRMGVRRAGELVARYREREPGFPDPAMLRNPPADRIPVPRIADRTIPAPGGGEVVVLTIRRPDVLNALDEELLRELDERLHDAAGRGAVAGVVLTGFGVRAFVAGADIRMLSRIASVAEGEQMSLRLQGLLDRIAALGKPVVAALNGVAYGGGIELAMACHARIARAGIRKLVSQPEPNLGLLPGAGGTQRLPRLIGIEAAWPLLRAATHISSEEALGFGLVSELTPGDELVARAVVRVADIAAGRCPAPSMPEGPIPVPDNLPEVDIGHRSRAVDALIRRAVLEGARMPLAEGLELEARLFGACCGLEDMRIGVTNFLENGPRKPAGFVHR